MWKRKGHVVGSEDFDPVRLTKLILLATLTILAILFLASIPHKEYNPHR